MVSPNRFDEKVHVSLFFRGVCEFPCVTRVRVLFECVSFREPFGGVTLKKFHDFFSRDGFFQVVTKMIAVGFSSPVQVSPA
jgi:hypothetical protein